MKKILNKSKNIKISLIIPIYNRELLLKESINSCLNQTEKIDEIILIDNNSTDNSYQIAKFYSGKYRNIRAIKNSKNLGMVKNWNAGIKLSKYKYVSILHSDDLLPNNWCAIVKKNIYKTLKKKLYINVFFGASTKVKLVNNRLKRFAYMNPFKKSLLLKPKESIEKLWTNFFININNSGAIIYNKDVFKKIGFFNDRIGYEADQDLHIKLLSKYNSYYINHNLVFYRYHNNQASFNRKPNNKNNSIESTINVITNSLKVQENNIENKELIKYFYCYILVNAIILLTTFHFKEAYKLLKYKELYNFKTLINIPRYVMEELRRRYIAIS